MDGHCHAGWCRVRMTAPGEAGLAEGPTVSTLRCGGDNPPGEDFSKRQRPAAPAGPAPGRAVLSLHSVTRAPGHVCPRGSVCFPPGPICRQRSQDHGLPEATCEDTQQGLTGRPPLLSTATCDLTPGPSLPCRAHLPEHGAQDPIPCTETQTARPHRVIPGVRLAR